MRLGVSLLILGFFAHQALAIVGLIIVTLAAVGLGVGGHFVEQAVLNRVNRLIHVFNDVVYLEIFNAEDADVANATGEYMIEVYDRLVRRLGYADLVDYLTDLHKFEKARNSTSFGVAEVEQLTQDSDDRKTMLLAGALGAGITPLLQWGVNMKYGTKAIFKDNSAYTYFTNAKARNHIKARVYCHRGTQQIRKLLKNGEIDDAEAKKRFKHFDQLIDIASSDAKSSKIDTELFDGADLGKLEVDFNKMNGRLNTAKSAALATFDNMSKAVEALGFLLDIVSIVQGELAKPKIEAMIEEIAVVRWQSYRAQAEYKIWSEYESRIQAAATVWGSLHDNLAETGGCYGPIDNQLAEASGNITKTMFDKFAALNNDVIYEKMRDNDREFGFHSLEYDPSKERLFQLLREKDALYDEGSGVTNSNSSIFDESAGDPIPADKTNGTNVRYVEFQNGQGALWKLTGQAWSLQLPMTAPGQATRHRLLEQERAGDRVSFKLDKTESVALPEAQRVNMVLHLVNGQGKLVWPGKPDLLVDTATPSNLIPVNGWTIYVADATVAANPADMKSLMPQSFEECNRPVGWTATVWQNQKFPGLREVGRNKTYVQASSLQQFDGELIQDYPYVDLDMTGEMMYYLSKIGKNEINRPRPANPESYRPRVYVD